MRIHILSINAPTFIPVMRYIIAHLVKQASVVITECRLKGSYAFGDAVKINTLGYFDGQREFNKQSRLFKITKYLIAIVNFRKYIQRNEENILYLIDYQLVGLLLWIIDIFKIKGIKVVYHQFETVETEYINGFQNAFFWKLFHKYSGNIALTIIPEKNRLEYLLSISQISANRTFILPNTCESAPDANPFLLHQSLQTLSEEAVLVGHVGSLGVNHYAQTFFDTVEKLKEDTNVYIVMVGNYSTEIYEYISKVTNPRFILIPTVPHKDLISILSRIDIGLILYKAVDKNFDFCAPNKLYEYWSHGIPVFAHPLQGLIPLFTNPLLGALVSEETPDALVENIRNYRRNPAQKAELKQHFNENLSIPSVIEKFQQSFNTYIHA